MGCGASVVDSRRLFLWRVRVIGAFNVVDEELHAGIGKPLYAELKSTGTTQTHRTKTVSQRNSVWNQCFYFNTDTKQPLLHVTVRKETTSLFGDPVYGTAVVDLTGLLSRHAERVMWLPLLTDDGKKAKTHGEIGIAVCPAYRCHVTLERGVGLAAMDSLTSTSDCYITVNVGQQEAQTTSVQGWTVDPIWDETFTVFVPYGVLSQLDLILWDRDHIGVNCTMGWHDIRFSGTPEYLEKRSFEVPVTAMQGTLYYSLRDDDQYDIELVDLPRPDNLPIPASLPEARVQAIQVLSAYNLPFTEPTLWTDFLTSLQNQVYHEFYEGLNRRPNAYVKLTCAGQVHTTQVVPETREPIWNETFHVMTTGSHDSYVLCEVCHEHLVLGRCEFPLKELVRPGEAKELWSFLEPRGELGMYMRMHALFRVVVWYATGLAARDLNNMSDPYVVLRLAGTEHRTSIVSNCRSPWFEEEFWFFVPIIREHTSELVVEVFDSDRVGGKGAQLSVDFLGRGTVGLYDLPAGASATHLINLTGDDPTEEAGEVFIEITHVQQTGEGKSFQKQSRLVPIYTETGDFNSFAYAPVGTDDSGDTITRLTTKQFQDATDRKNFFQAAANSKLLGAETGIKSNMGGGKLWGKVSKTVRRGDMGKFAEERHGTVAVKNADGNNRYEIQVATRPRFTKIQIELLGVRGLDGMVVDPTYFGIMVPAQGRRDKTRKEYWVHPRNREQFEKQQKEAREMEEEHLRNCLSQDTEPEAAAVAPDVGDDFGDLSSSPTIRAASSSPKAVSKKNSENKPLSRNNSEQHSSPVRRAESLVEQGEPPEVDSDEERHHQLLFGISDDEEDDDSSDDGELGLALAVREDAASEREEDNKQMLHPATLSFRVGEKWNYHVPSRLTGGFQVVVFESLRHPYTAVDWPTFNFCSGGVLFSDVNDGEGLHRGGRESNDDVEVPLFDLDGESCGTALCRVIELLRFQICVLEGANMPKDKDLRVCVYFKGVQRVTEACPRVPRADGTSGKVGEPLWNEQYTFFSSNYSDFRICVVDENDELVGQKVTIPSSELSRGIPLMRDLIIDPETGATVKIRILDEGAPDVTQRKLERAKKRVTMGFSDIVKQLFALTEKLKQEAKDDRKNFREKHGEGFGSAEKRGSDRILPLDDGYSTEQSEKSNTSSPPKSTGNQVGNPSGVKVPTPPLLRNSSPPSVRKVSTEPLPKTAAVVDDSSPPSVRKVSTEPLPKTAAVVDDSSDGRSGPYVRVNITSETLEQLANRIQVPLNELLQKNLGLNTPSSKSGGSAGSALLAKGRQVYIPEKYLPHFHPTIVEVAKKHNCDPQQLLTCNDGTVGTLTELVSKRARLLLPQTKTGENINVASYAKKYNVPLNDLLQANPQFQSGTDRVLQTHKTYIPIYEGSLTKVWADDSFEEFPWVAASSPQPEQRSARGNHEGTLGLLQGETVGEGDSPEASPLNGTLGRDFTTKFTGGLNLGGLVPSGAGRPLFSRGSGNSAAPYVRVNITSETLEQLANRIQVPLNELLLENPGLNSNSNASLNGTTARSSPLAKGQQVYIPEKYLPKFYSNIVDVARKHNCDSQLLAACNIATIATMTELISKKERLLLPPTKNGENVNLAQYADKYNVALSDLLHANPHFRSGTDRVLPYHQTYLPTDDDRPFSSRAASRQQNGGLFLEAPFVLSLEAEELSAVAIRVGVDVEVLRKANQEKSIRKNTTDQRRFGVAGGPVSNSTQNSTSTMVDLYNDGNRLPLGHAVEVPAHLLPLPAYHTLTEIATKHSFDLNQLAALNADSLTACDHELVPKSELCRIPATSMSTSMSNSMSGVIPASGTSLKVGDYVKEHNLDLKDFLRENPQVSSENTILNPKALIYLPRPFQRHDDEDDDDGPVSASVGGDLNQKHRSAAQRGRKQGGVSVSFAAGDTNPADSQKMARENSFVFGRSASRSSMEADAPEITEEELNKADAKINKLLEKDDRIALLDEKHFKELTEEFGGDFLTKEEMEALFSQPELATGKNLTPEQQKIAQKQLLKAEMAAAKVAKLVEKKSRKIAKKQAANFLTRAYRSGVFEAPDEVHAAASMVASSSEAKKERPARFGNNELSSVADLMKEESGAHARAVALISEESRITKSRFQRGAKSGELSDSSEDDMNAIDPALGAGSDFKAFQSQSFAPLESELQQGEDGDDDVEDDGEDLELLQARYETMNADPNVDPRLLDELRRKIRRKRNRRATWGNNRNGIGGRGKIQRNAFEIPQFGAMKINAASAGYGALRGEIRHRMWEGVQNTVLMQDESYRELHADYEAIRSDPFHDESRLKAVEEMLQRRAEELEQMRKEAKFRRESIIEFKADELARKQGVIEALRSAAEKKKKDNDSLQAAKAEEIAKQRATAQLLVEAERIKREVTVLKRRAAIRLKQGKTSAISEEELVILRRHFEIMDSDGSGEMDKTEFVQFYKNIGGDILSKQELLDIFDSLDVDGGGTLQFDEFVKVYSKVTEAEIQKGGLQMVVSAMQEALDKKKALSEEARAAAAAQRAADMLKSGAAKVKREVEMLKRKAQIRMKQGKADAPISSEELVILRRHFDVMDSDGSGEMDKTEFVQFYKNIGGDILSKQELLDIFDSLDVDGGGTLQFDEFVKVYSKVTEAELQKQATGKVGGNQPGKGGRR